MAGAFAVGAALSFGQFHSSNVELAHESRKPTPTVFDTLDMLPKGRGGTTKPGFDKVFERTYFANEDGEFGVGQGTSLATFGLTAVTGAIALRRRRNPPETSETSTETPGEK